MAVEADWNGLEPDLFGVLRDRWILIVGLAFVFGIIGFLVGSTQAIQYQSTASVVVEDPRAAALFESGSSSKPERYVETQIGIMSSPAVAERASELLQAGPPSIDVPAEEILAGAEMTAQDNSDLISVSFTSGSADASEAAANAIIDAYLELRNAEAVEGFDSALSQLDDSIEQARADLEQIHASIQAARGIETIGLKAEAEAAVARLLELEGDAEGDVAEIQALSDQLQGIETLLRIENLQPELTALLEDQRLAQSRLSTLLARRNEVSVDAELSGGGIVFQTQATPAQRTNPSSRAYAAFAGVIGLMLGVAIAYSLAIWRRRVSSPEQPETILRAPSLGTVPAFDVVVRTAVPVANAPDSRPAEAFRFVMAALESQLFRPGSSRQGHGEKMVLVTSASAHDGRSTLVANMAIAAARSGRRVLVLDADFVTQGVTQILLPDSPPRVGITEVVIGASSLENAVKEAQLVPGIELHLLSRGSDLMGAQDIFGSLEAAELLDRVREQYDLVLVDSPPLPTVGYATTLARLSDGVLVVVPHRTQVSKLEELNRRLALIQSRRIGYVYNKAPGQTDTRRGTRRPVTREEEESGADVFDDDRVMERISET